MLSYPGAELLFFLDKALLMSLGVYGERSYGTEGASTHGNHFSFSKSIVTGSSYQDL